MAGYENIKNANSNRTPEERRELARIAGKASGAARRRTANFRRTLNMLLTAEIDSPEYSPMLEALGVDCTLESAMLMAQIKEAMQGNTKAAYFVAQYAGQSSQTDADLEEQKIRTDRAKRARDQEVGSADSGNDNIQSFLRAMRPTHEDLDDLFTDEEAEGDAEEAEEASDL